MRENDWRVPGWFPSTWSGLMQARRAQIDSLTGLRGVAACWVALMHFREITPTRIFEYPVLDKAISNGAYGVDVFFVLSGFILCHVYGASFRAGLAMHEVRCFMAYRFARIYPVHLATFALMMVLFAAKSLSSGAGELPDRYGQVTVLTTLTLTNAWLPGLQTPNMPAWSVSAEWFAYVLFPGLCFLLSWKNWAPALYIVVGIGLAFFQPFGNNCLTHVLSGFLIGMVASESVSLISQTSVSRFAGLAVASAIVIWAQRATPPVPIGLLLFSGLIVALTSPSDLLSRILSVRPVIYLGEISYSIYMVHWPTRVIVRNCLQVLGLLDALPSSLLVCAYTLVTLTAAALSYRYIEVPGREFVRRAADYRGRWLSGVTRPE